MATTTWSFVSSVQGWTFLDVSSGSSSSSMAHSASAESLRCTMTIVSGETAIDIFSPELNIPVLIGDTIEADYTWSDIPSGNGVVVRANYTDATFDAIGNTRVAAGTDTLTVTVNKTLETIQLGFARGAGASYVADYLEVRLITASAPTTGIRPLGLDVDVESGANIWTTYLDISALLLKLRKYNSALESTGTFDFGAATEAQVDARTFYLSPYAPAFFGTAGLDDIIYVYGRWDDGAVTHIEKSTDGGASFTDIGDSATWGADWVGGFFADDASTLYAFVNGASPQLYRSLNGGTSWTSLSVMPFEVDPEAVSKHSDGRILIANRASGAQMVAFADSAYSSWTNATGSPSFPTAGGGARSIVWVT